MIVWKYKLTNVKKIQNMKYHSYNCTGMDDAAGLKKYGRYYEEIVQNVDNVLELHKQDTTSIFGIRRTEKPSSCSTSKENDKQALSVNV